MRAGRPGRTPIRWWAVAGLYLVVALAWVLGSDLLLFAFVAETAALSLAKGVAFVVVTAALLAGLLRRYEHGLILRERKLAELATQVQRREVELGLVDERSPDLVVHLEQDPARVTFVSAAARQLVGYDPAELRGEPKRLAALLHPADAALVGVPDQPARWPETLRLRWRHRDGHTLWVDQRVTVEVGEEPRPRAVTLSGREVTAEVLRGELRELAARLDAEVVADQPLAGALRSLADDLGALVEAPAVLIEVTDRRGGSTRIQTAPEPRPLPGVGDDNDDARTGAATDGWLRVTGDRVVVALRLGRSSPTEAALAAVLPELVDRLGTAAETARQQLELHRFAHALESSAAGVLVVDTAGTVVWFNPAFTEQTGDPAEVIRGGSIDSLAAEPDAPSIYGRVRSAVAAGGSFSAQVTATRRGGEAFVAAATIDPVHAPSGELVGHVAVQKDVTEEVAAQAALQAREAQARDRERGLDHDRALLVQLLSHELRTPLTVLVGAAETLEREGLTADQRSRVVTAMVAARVGIVERLQALLAATDDLRGSDVELELEEVLRELLAARAGDGDRVEVAGSARWVGDRVLLSAALRPVLDNALRYAGVDGRVQVTVTPELSGAVQVAIVDTGPGIEPELLALIRQPFRQAELETTRTVSGLGLGLHVAHRAMQRLGGQLTIASDGDGTTVTLHLPPAPGSAG